MASVTHHFRIDPHGRQFGSKHTKIVCLVCQHRKRLIHTILYYLFYLETFSIECDRIRPHTSHKPSCHRFEYKWIPFSKTIFIKPILPLFHRQFFCSRKIKAIGFLIENVNRECLMCWRVMTFDWNDDLYEIFHENAFYLIDLNFFRQKTMLSK